MRSEIKITDIDNKEIIKFSEFDFQFDTILRRILLNVSIEFEIFKANQQMELEEADFLYLRDGLEKIYTSGFKKIFFKPMIDQRISLEFIIHNKTNIVIHGNFYNTMFTGELKFKFETGIIQIQSFVKEIDELLGQYSKFN